MTTTANTIDKKQLSKAEQTALDFITAKLAENKQLPWAKPWTQLGFKLPFNYTTGNTFSGLNLIMCMFFDTPEFATFKAISKELGGKVKKGSKAIPLLRPTTLYYLDGKKLSYKEYTNLSVEKKGLCKKVVLFTTYYVFNLETQTEGIEIKREKIKDFTPQLRSECDKLINLYSENECKINIITSGKAFYSPSNDEITLPRHEQFEKTEMFYSTAFHEMIHSTGHAKRLKREGVASLLRTKETYAKEELVAEIGASILNATYGTFDNTKYLNAAYVKNWLQALKNDPAMIIEASKDSKKAIDYILKYQM